MLVRRCGVLAISVGLLLLFVYLLSPIVSADELASVSYTVTAIVEPIRYVVVDNSDMITEIMSNSNINVKPVFYMNSLKSNPIKPSPQMLVSYNKLIGSLNTNKPGVIYTNTSLRSLSYKQQIGNYLSDVSLINLDLVRL